MHPTGQMTLNCYVDAYFPELWGQEDKQDPTCIKSRTIFLLEFLGCPLLWVSKLQTEITLSTTEAEYISLSQSMRELLPAKCMLKEVLGHFGSELKDTCSHSVFEDNNGAIALATAPKMNARTKHIAVKYHHFWHHISEGVVRVVKVDTTAQKADLLTEDLGPVKFPTI